MALQSGIVREAWDLGRRFGTWFSRLVPVVFLAACLVSCAHTPRWTPQAVEPPQSVEVAQESVARAVAEEETAGPASDKSSMAPAPQPISLPLTRDGAVLTALARNRSLAVAKFEPEIAASYIQEARGAFDPALLATVSYGRDTRPYSQAGLASVANEEESVVSRQFQTDLSISEPLPTGTEVFLSGGFSRSHSSSSSWTYEGSWSVGVNQSLLRGLGPDANLVTLRQARNTAAKSRHEFRSSVLELVYQVENAYWELVLATNTLKIREFSVQLAKDQLELNQDLIAVGKLSADAVVSAEAELASRKAELVDARIAVKERTIDLICLLNPEAAAQWNLTFETLDPPDIERIDLNPEISVRLAGLYRPELAQSRLELANRDLEVVRTRNGLLPKLDAFASYGRFSSGATGSDASSHLNDSKFDSYQFGLLLDMSPLNRSERAAHRRAKFQQQQAEVAIENLERIIEAEVRQAALEVEKQWERIGATKQAVESRQEELEVEKSRFLVGKCTNLDVAQVHRDLIQAQLDEVTARVRYIQAITSLYLAEGTLLSRRGVGT